MTDTYLELDGVSSSDITELVVEDVVRQMTPTIRDSYLDVAGRPGAWRFDEAAGDRSLAVKFAAVGDTNADRRAALRRAGAFLYGTGRGARKLVISDEPDRFVYAKLAETPSAEELLRLGRFTATFRTSPFAEAVAPSSATIAGTGIGWTDTVTVPAEVGLIDRLAPSVEVTATGSASYFAFNINGVTIYYGGAITAGTKVTVSTISATVTAGADTDTELDGTFDPSALAMTSVAGDFPYLVPGANLVTGQGPISLAFRWRARYV